MIIKVEIIKQLQDNYAYVVYSEKSKQSILIDPAETEPILTFLDKKKLTLEGILATHHHSDHTQGIAEIKNKFNLKVFSPNRKIEGTTDLLKDKQKISFSFIDFNIIGTPGHTLDHVVFFSEKEKLLFSGDTLFCYGCGRVFEGTYEQMLNSLNKLKTLPNETKIYCGHEYTYKNLEFLLHEVAIFFNKGSKLSECRNEISTNGSSMPFLLGHQKELNPFLNCDDMNYKHNIADFSKNVGKISVEANELEFFTFIREKRNKY